MTKDTAPKPEAKPHYFGHRQRLRERFLQSNGDGMADYELLELILFASKPRGDVKPLAKKLLTEFGGFSKVMTASVDALMKVPGMGESAVSAIMVTHTAMQRLLREEITGKPIIQSWNALLDYAKASMAHKKIEEFRILFLNRRNELIRDEVQQRGTVDHTPVYTREVVKRALELGASSIILMHNHPSGDAAPSKADIDITKQVADASKSVGIKVHDHLIISENGHYSFRANGII